MSNCSTCIRHDRDCVIDPQDGVECRQYVPTLVSAVKEGIAGIKAGRVTEMDFSPHVESENPDHYKTGGIECIDALRDALGHEGFIAYCRGQIIRYAWRIGKKDACLVEALKLENYANWLVDEFKGTELRK